MSQFTEEELLLIALFEGPVRPLTREDQMEQEERNRIYEEKARLRHEGYAKVLGISVERVEVMAKENPIGLIERVALRKLSDPDGSRARHIRVLFAPR